MTTHKSSQGDPVNFETIKLRVEGSVVFAELLAPPMNLLGPEVVRDLVSFIQRAEADDAVKVIVFKGADPDYFISHVDVTRIKENREPGDEAYGRTVAPIGGEKGIGEGVVNTMKLVADNVESAIIPGSGHWVAEAAPDKSLAALTPFLAPYRDAR